MWLLRGAGFGSALVLGKVALVELSVKGVDEVFQTVKERWEHKGALVVGPRDFDASLTFSACPTRTKQLSG